MKKCTNATGEHFFELELTPSMDVIETCKECKISFFHSANKIVHVDKRVKKDE
jgi:hypothetical protein